MQQLYYLFGELRKVYLFRLCIQLIVIVLMILGTWVATKTLSFPPGVSINDKAIHIIVFFGFSVLMDVSIIKSPFWLWKGLPLLAYGLFIEVLQYFTPFRMFSLADVIADLFGVLIYIMMRQLFMRKMKHKS